MALRTCGWALPIASGGVAGQGPSRRALNRLEDELLEDGIPLPDDEALRKRLLEELHVVRRPRLHERRRAMYGSLVLPPGRSLVPLGDLADVLALDVLDPDRARLFADGRSTFLVRQYDGSLSLACFARSVQYEANLVDVQEATGALITQRTSFGTPRMFEPEGVVEWNGSEWRFRPNAATRVPLVSEVAPMASYDVLTGVLDLCVHWLSPGQVGATLVLLLDPFRSTPNGVECAASFPGPPLSVRIRHHLPSFLVALSQSDLALVVDHRGKALQFAVGLQTSAESDRLVHDPRGMRHRSGRRYSFDHPDTLVFVVSEDGPVTVFSDGATIANTDPGVHRALARSMFPTEQVRCPRCGRLVELVKNASSVDAPACPVCGETDSFENSEIVRVVKEWRPDGASVET